MTWSDDDLDLALSGLKDEALPVGAESAVRARVLAAVERPRRRWWWFAWAPVVAALVVLVWMVRVEEVVPAPPLVARAPEARPPERAPRSVVRAKAPVRVRETEFVRIETDDPDVVILWALNPEGEDR